MDVFLLSLKNYFHQCFASRAKSIKNKPKLNEVMSDAALLKRYKKQIDILSQKLQNVDDKNHSDEVQEMVNELEETKKMNQALLERINLLQSSILSSETKQQSYTGRGTTKHKTKRRQTWAAPTRHSLYTLPTIPEKSPEKSCRLDLMLENCDIPLSDFEYELYNCQQSILLEENESLICSTQIQVSNVDNINYSTLSGCELTPRNSLSLSRSPQSPGTPKFLLREKLNYTLQEFEELKEHTTLEKLLRAEDQENDLRNEFAQVKHQMRTIRQENQTFYETICQNELEIDALSKQNEELKRRLDENEELKEKLENMEEKLSNYQKQCLKYESMIMKTSSDNEVISNEKTEELKQKLEFAEKELTELKSSFDDSKIKTDSKDKTGNYSEKFDQEKDQLKQLLRNAQEQLVLWEDKVTEYKEKLVKLEISNEELVEERKRDGATIMNFEIRIQTLEAENNVLTDKMNQLSKMRREKEELTTKYQELEKNAVSFEEKIKQQYEDLQNLHNENDRLQGQINEFLQKEEKLKIENFEDTICKLKSEKDLLNEALKKALDECEQLKSCIQSADEKANDYQNKINISDKALQILEQENISLKEQITDFKKQMFEHEQKTETLEIVNQKLKKHVEDMEQQLTNIHVEDLADRIKHLEEQKEEVQNKCEDLMKRIQILESEKISLIKEIDEHQYQLNNKELTVIQEMYDNEKQTVKNLTLNFEEQKSTLIEMENKIKEYQMEKEDMTEKIKELEEQKLDYKNKYDLLKEQLSITKSENCLTKKSLEESLGNLQQLLNNEKCKSDEFKLQSEEQHNIDCQKLANLQQILNQEKQKFDDLKANLEKQRNLDNQSISNLQKLLNEDKQKFEELEAQFEEQRNLDSQELANLQILLKEEKQKFDILLEQFEKQKDAMKNMEHKLNEYVQEKECFEHKVQILTEENQSYQRKYEQLQENIQILNTEKTAFVKTIEQQFHFDKVQFEKQHNDFIETENLLKECRQEKDNLVSQIKEFVELNQEYQSRCKQLQEKNNILEERSIKTTEEQHLNDKELQDLRQTLNEQKQKYETLREKFEEQKLRLVNLEEDAVNYQKQIMEHDEKISKINSTPNYVNTCVKLEKFDSLEGMDSDLMNRSKNLIKCESDLNASPLIRRKIDDVLQKSSPLSLNSTSIFNNDSYFDKLEVTQDETFSEADSILEKSTLVNENKKLRVQLQAQIQERRDIENDIRDLKLDMCKLQQTVYDLTSENTELSENLNKEKAKFEEMETNLKMMCNELQAKLLAITTEKTDLENILLIVKDNLGIKSTSFDSSNEFKKQLQDYKQKLENLVMINEELSKNLKVTIKLREEKEHDLSNQLLQSLKELDNLKDLNSELLKQHQEINDKLLTYSDVDNIRQENITLRDTVVDLEIRIEHLSKENEKLSMDLIETVEDLEKIQNSSDSNNEMLLKIKVLEDQITQLTIDNEKLSEMKQCSFDKSSNEVDDRSLRKAEVKCLNRQLKDFQKKYEQKVAETESLRIKAKESLDESLMNDSLNVSFIQEKIICINNEFDSLKDVHRLLSISFQEKYDEIENLQTIISTSFLEGMNSAQIEKKDKIDKLCKDLDVLRHDLKKISNEYTGFKSVLDKFVEDNTYNKQEIEFMKSENEELRQKIILAEAQSSTLANENIILNDKINKCHDFETELQHEKINLESVVDKLKVENSNFEDLVSSLKKSVQEMKEIESSLNNELENLREEKEQLIARQNYTESVLQEYKQNIEESDFRIKEANNNLNIQIKENNELKNQLTKLQSEAQNTTLKNKEAAAKKELDEARVHIVKEIKSLNPNTKILAEETISNLFSKLLQTLMKKEAEIIRDLQDQITSAEQKRQEEKHERNEVEKKTNQWIKSLEMDNEKLQAELSDFEKKNHQYEKNIELLKKLKTEIDTYRSQIVELNLKIETLKLNNKELLTKIDIFERSETELKNIIDTITNENTKLKTQLEQVSTAYTKLNSEIIKKNNQIENIMLLLKEERENYSEYHKQLEILKPEHQILQKQVLEYRKNIDEYKNDINSLKENLIKVESDSLISKKQLENEINKFTILDGEYKQLEEKYANLEMENAKLSRKVRNSTNRIALEELEDKNKMLKNNLEGVSNRIIMLQQQNSDYIEEITKLQQKINNYEHQINNCDNRNCNTNEQILILEQKIERLINSNKELDEENTDLANMVTSLQDENSVLMLKVQEFEMAADIEESREQLIARSLRMETMLTERKLHIEKLEKQIAQADIQISLAEKNATSLSNKNKELQGKVKNLEDKLEMLSTRSNSPAFENGLRRQRRSNQFNQNRNLESKTCECVETYIDDTACACNSLRQQIRTLELEIVEKNCKISTLELQIKSENFPFQEKCKQLKNTVAVYQTKNSELQSQIRKLERAIQTNALEDCEVCKQQLALKRDQGIQFPEKTICMTGVQSGIVDEHVKVQKLEKEKDFIKQVCRNRQKKVIELELKLKKYIDRYGNLPETVK